MSAENKDNFTEFPWIFTDMDSILSFMILELMTGSAMLSKKGRFGTLKNEKFCLKRYTNVYC